MIFRITKVRRGWRGQKWMYQIIGGNGEPMMSSELLKNRVDCYEAVEAIQAEAALARIEETYK